MNFEKPNQASDAPTQMTRRGFLKAGVGLAGVALLGNQTIEESVPTIPDGKRWQDYELDKAESELSKEIEDSINALKAGLEEKYNFKLELTFDEINASPHAVKKDLYELRPALKLEALMMLEYTLAKYPTFVISKSGLEHVLITTRVGNNYINDVGGYVATGGHLEALDRVNKPELTLAYDWNSGDEIPPALRTEEQVPEGMSYEDYVSDELYTKKQNFEIATHHELLHFFVDVEGTESSTRLDEGKFTAEWNDIFGHFNNASREVYTEELQKQSKSDTVSFTDLPFEPHGFARSYGVESDLEDRATIVEFLMTGYEDQLAERYKDEPILEVKVRDVKNFYHTFSYGLIDEEYWQLVKTVSKDFNFKEHFTQKAAEILRTPYSDYKSKDSVDEVTYSNWQARLKLEYPQVN